MTLNNESLATDLLSLIALKKLKIIISFSIVHILLNANTAIIIYNIVHCLSSVVQLSFPNLEMQY